MFILTGFWLSDGSRRIPESLLVWGLKLIGAPAIRSFLIRVCDLC